MCLGSQKLIFGVTLVVLRTKFKVSEWKHCQWIPDLLLVYLKKIEHFVLSTLFCAMIAIRQIIFKTNVLDRISSLLHCKHKTLVACSQQNETSRTILLHPTQNFEISDKNPWKKSKYSLGHQKLETFVGFSSKGN